MATAAANKTNTATACRDMIEASPRSGTGTSAPTDGADA